MITPASPVTRQLNEENTNERDNLTLRQIRLISDALKSIGEYLQRFGVVCSLDYLCVFRVRYLRFKSWQLREDKTPPSTVIKFDSTLRSAILPA